MNRQETIKSLLQFDSDLNTLRERVLKLTWDSDEQLECSPLHILHVLERFLVGARTAKEVEEWANLVEGRDDISFPPRLKEVIFELANPGIAEPLTIARARKLVRSLSDG